MTDDGAAHARPKRKAFVKRFREARLSPEEAKRQGLIVHLAHVLLGREEAISFLNADNETLGGRPLDLAISSTAGYSTVENAIQSLVRRQAGRIQ